MHIMTTHRKSSLIGDKLFGNSHSSVLQSPQSQHDINCINFSKLSINSRKDLKHSNNNNNSISNSNSNSSTITGTGNSMMSSSNDDRNYRPILPRIEFPSAQFDRLLRMDSNQLNKHWKQTTDNNKNNKCDKR